MKQTRQNFRLIFKLVFIGILGVGLTWADKSKPTSILKEMQFQQRKRLYWLHLPPWEKTGTEIPLVVVMHGGGGNGKSAEAMSGFSAKADKEGFIVVYPYGTGEQDDRSLTWNAGTCCGYALFNGVDDVGFIRTLVEELADKYPIDRTKIFATGMSNGGMMAYRLACEASDIFSGIGDVAGAMNVQSCESLRTVSMMIIHGRADLVVLFEGGARDKSVTEKWRHDRSVSYAINFWKKRNGCKKFRKSKKGIVTRRDYQCTHAPLSLVVIKNEGHTWPGGEKLYEGADEPTQKFSATDALWEFWNHSQPDKKNLQPEEKLPPKPDMQIGMGETLREKLLR